MWRGWVVDSLLPERAEANPEFRRELLRLSHIGLLVVGGVQVAVAVFMFVARFFVAPDPASLEARMWQSGAVTLLGALTFAAAGWRPLYPWSRQIALCFGVVVAAVLFWSSLTIARVDPVNERYIPGQATLILLVGVTAIPLRPLHTFIFGLLIAALYAILAQAYNPLGPDPVVVLFLFMLTLLSTGLTAVLYNQRWRVFQDAEYMRQAQSRILLAENAAQVGRLAAALSHELNSPVGALVSGVDTLLLLAARQATTGPGEQQRLVRLQNDLRKSIRESVERLNKLVARMQRFTNLDKAEVQQADINDLLADVLALADPKLKGKTEVQFDPQPLPPLVCRPQQISAVFGDIVANALQAVNGDGGIVRVATGRREGEIEVRVQDNGQGMDSQDLENIFDPGFKVRDGRMAAANWSMFGSRQIVREHGGDIQIHSAKGVGTTVVVTLPLVAEASSSGGGLAVPT